MDRATCRLPGAYWDHAGRPHRDAVLRPLSGAEEELLVEAGDAASASLVTQVLSRCVLRLGDIQPVTEEVARRLLVADRDYLLLKLRQLTFGDRVQATVACPWPHCGTPADIDFSIDAVPVREARDPGPFYSVSLPDAADADTRGGVPREVGFRLPNGEDQELLAPLLAQNEARALTGLLARCLVTADGVATAGDELVQRLSARARQAIEQNMEERAPALDLTLNVSCPECGRQYPVPFEIQDFFFGELRNTRDLLQREVHYLAYHYHWSEAEILAFTRAKRRRYIETLADEIERLNHASGQ